MSSFEYMNNFDVDDIDKFITLSISNNIDNDIKLISDEDLYNFEQFLNYYINLKHVNNERKAHINNIIMKAIKNETSVRKNKIMQESDISLRPTVQLTLDTDGNLLLIKREHVNFETIYANSHDLLKIYEDSNNIEGIKYELCKQWMCKSLIDYKLLYAQGIRARLISSKQRRRAITLKSFIMNDIKKYLKIINKSEPDFNFQEYFNKTQFGIEIYKIDNRVVKASKLLFGAFK